MVPVSGSTCAHSSGPIRHTIYQTEPIVYGGSNLSLFLRISWNQMPGGEGVPPCRHGPGTSLTDWTGDIADTSRGRSQ
jgi:hypothetical protein